MKNNKNKKEDYSIKIILDDMDSHKYAACWAADASNKASGEKPHIKTVIAILNNIMNRHVERWQNLLGKEIDIKKWHDKGLLKHYVSKMDRSNFRFEVATIQPYKENRKDMEKPAYLDEIQEHMIKKWGAIEVSGMEADDALGIEATKNPRHTMISHSDKDLWQVPCWHDNYSKTRVRPLTYVENPGVFYLERYLPDRHTDEDIENKEAKLSKPKLELFTTGQYRLYYQMIVGDKSDNIPKVVKETKDGREYGYGDMEIYDIFKKAECLQFVTASLFSKHYGDKGTAYITERMHEIKQLVGIRMNET